MIEQVTMTESKRARRIALVIGAMVVGAALLPDGTAAAQAAAPAKAPRTGAQIFSSTCAACHQAQGEGTNVYPPLAGSEWVNGPESRVVRIILHGLIGDVEVQGQVYNGAMPAWGPTLSDGPHAGIAPLYTCPCTSTSPMRPWRMIRTTRDSGPFSHALPASGG